MIYLISMIIRCIFAVITNTRKCLINKTIKHY